jgi:hypothetical protein
MNDPILEPTKVQNVDKESLNALLELRSREE